MSTTHNSVKNIIITDFFGGYDQGQSVAVQLLDNKILLGGYTIVDSANSDFAMARYNSNGSLDTTFSSDGKVVATIVASIDEANSVIFQPLYDKILLGGWTKGFNNNIDFFIMRYNSDGTLDNSFSDDGIVVTNFASVLPDKGQSIAVQTVSGDSKILLAGFSYIASNSNFALARYNSDGSLDTTFGSSGIVTTDFGSIDEGSSVTVDSVGKILLGGYMHNSNGTVDFALVRYDSVTGVLDPSFGQSSTGKVTTPLGIPGVNFAYGYSVAIDTSGNILLGGSSRSQNGNRSDFAIVRYLSTGFLDTSFGGDGIVTTDVGMYDEGRSVAVDGDGKILLGGSTVNGDGNSDFTLLRYNKDGTLDTMFGGNGIVTTDFVNNDKGQSVTIEGDGKILLGGSSNGDFALLRYNKDGTPDLTFNGLKIIYGDGGVNSPKADFVTSGSADNQSSNDADTIYGYKLNDTLYGGSGNDTIDGGEDSDKLYGENGDDSLYGGDGGDADYLDGGVGNDTLNGGAGADVLVGGAGNDTYYVDNASDSITESSSGGSGTDTVVVMVSSLFTSYQLPANVEKGTIQGTQGSLLTGNLLNNTLTGGVGNDTLKGGTGADRMIGGVGNDTYYVDNLGDSVIETNASTSQIDTVYSSISYPLPLYVENLHLLLANGNLTGNSLNNTLYASSGDNVIDGVSGNDTVSYAEAASSVTIDLSLTIAQPTVGSGSDTLLNIDNIVGSPYGDTLTGTIYPNTLTGGAGLDTLKGDGGRDVFRLTDATSNSKDTILDFTVTDGDTIQLDHTIFTKLTIGSPLNPANFYSGSVAHEGDDYIIYNNGAGALYYDEDGNGTAHLPIQIALIGTTGNHPTLTNANFSVI
ncbi:MAG: hypothetical protein D4R41_02625 [Sediminibacterium sp.]|nr:MAG: hypothetical protein D4R41_02625 [Sediminibacterium sp.]